MLRLRGRFAQQTYFRSARSARQNNPLLTIENGRARQTRQLSAAPADTKAGRGRPRETASARPRPRVHPAPRGRLEAKSSRLNAPQPQPTPPRLSSRSLLTAGPAGRLVGLEACDAARTGRANPGPPRDAAHVAFAAPAPPPPRLPRVLLRGRGKRRGRPRLRRRNAPAADFISPPRRRRRLPSTRSPRCGASRL